MSTTSANNTILLRLSPKKCTIVGGSIDANTNNSESLLECTFNHLLALLLLIREVVSASPTPATTTFSLDDAIERIKALLSEKNYPDLASGLHVDVDPDSEELFFAFLEYFAQEPRFDFDQFMTIVVSGGAIPSNNAALEEKKKPDLNQFLDTCVQPANQQFVLECFAQAYDVVAKARQQQRAQGAESDDANNVDESLSVLLHFNNNNDQQQPSTTPTSTALAQQQQQQQQQPATPLSNHAPAAAAAGAGTTTPQQRESLKMGLAELSTGFDAIFMPSLNQLSHQLDEVARSQQQLLIATRIQNEELSNLPQFKEMEATFLRIPDYIQKTKQIQRDMKALKERVEKLTKRAQKLQAHKQKQMQEEAAQREREIHKQAFMAQQLLAKPAKRTEQKKEEPS